MSGFFPKEKGARIQSENQEERGLPLSASFIRMDNPNYYEELRAKYIEMQKNVDDLKHRGLFNSADPRELRQFEAIKEEFLKLQTERFPRLPEEESDNLKKNTCIIL